jgi:predicted metal-dependent hydrolase
VREIDEGVELFNSGRYFEAHEEWEKPWLKAPEGSAEKLFIQGLIMLAAALDHYLKGEYAGTAKLIDKGLSRLNEHRSVAMGIDMEGLLGQVNSFHEKFKACGGKGIPREAFPRIAKR